MGPSIVLYRDILAINAFLDSNKKPNFFDFLNILFINNDNSDRAMTLLQHVILLKLYQNKKYINWLQLTIIPGYMQQIESTNKSLKANMTSLLNTLDIKINLYIAKMQYIVRKFFASKKQYLNYKTANDIQERIKNQLSVIKMENLKIKKQLTALRRQLDNAKNLELYVALGKFLCHSREYKTYCIKTYKFVERPEPSKIFKDSDEFIDYIFQVVEREDALNLETIRENILHNNEYFFILYKILFIFNMKVLDFYAPKVPIFSSITTVEMVFTVFNAGTNIYLYAFNEKDPTRLALFFKMLLLLLFRPFFIFYAVGLSNPDVTIQSYYKQ